MSSDRAKIKIVNCGDGSWDNHIDLVLTKLRELYDTRVRPLEEAFQYDIYQPSWFAETIVQKKPFILFIGPWSTGKSTFINYLMQANYLTTGPHPTTDKFTIILHGEELEQIPGRVLTSDSSHPFRGLGQFGDAFVESFHAVRAPHPILRSCSLIDSPGVLESGGEVNKRRYDYIKVMRWFVERSDLVFFMFDPTKLDAGPEMRKVFKHALYHQESKIRIVLNKADTVGAQELMRVYGSLFWTLSNLVNSTEPPRVYVSSFWDQPYKPNTNHELFSDEKADLIYELTDTIPRQSLDKRVSAVLRRANDVLHHSMLCATMRQRLPKLFGKDKAVKAEIEHLQQTSTDLAERNKLSIKDFGTVEEYKKFFAKVDMLTLPDMEKCKRKNWITNIQKAINEELPMLLKPIKEAPVDDPRDRKQIIMKQREYNVVLQRQMEGEKGRQGALGQMETPAYRTDCLPNASTWTQPASVGPDPMQVQMMMQMMIQQQLLQQQQQQQQQQQLTQMTPEQQLMMMQMMQQQTQ
eukprot:Tbor_TRINITY_DN5826_c1_g2::TRINITY_DN5826_c1_g2_i1::g.6084::m.6084